MRYMHEGRRHGPSVVARYGFAIIATVLAIVGTFFLGIPRDVVAFIFFWLAIITSAVYGGLGPGLLSIAFCGAVAAFWLGTEGRAAGVESAFLVGRWFVFVPSATVVVWAVSLRHRAENAVNELRIWLSTTLDGINEAVIATDTTGTIIYANTAALHLLGGAAVSGRKFSDAFHIRDDDSGAPVDDLVEQVLKTGSVASLPLQSSVDVPGGAIAIEGSAAPIVGENGATGVVVALQDAREKRARERAVLQEFALFRTMADAAPVMIWVADTTKLCTFFNRQWLQFTGRALHEELGNGWAGGVHPDDRAECLRVYGEAFAAREQFRMEYRLRRHDGEYRWLFDHGVPRYSASGVFEGYIGSCIDFTERRLAEESLARDQRLIQRNEDRLRALVAASTQIVWTADADGSVVEESATWREVTGQTERERFGWGWMEAVDAEDRERVSKAVHGAVAEGLPLEVEFRLRHSDGRSRWYVMRAVPVLEADASVREWIATCTDIELRKRAEVGQEVLSDAGNVLGHSLDYEATLQNLASVLVPRLADLCSVNLAEDGGGYRRVRNAHPGSELEQITSELDARFPHPARDLVVEVLATGQPMLIAEIDDSVRRTFAVDDAHFELLRRINVTSFIIVPMKHRGRTVGTINLSIAGSSRRYDAADLSLAIEIGRRAAHAIENARLYQEAAAANRAKDEFLATLSHELRTPLTSIMGWSKLLRVGEVDDETLKLALETIERSAKAQAELIDEVLDVSRIVTGKFSLEVGEMNLVSVVRQLIGSLHPAAEAKDITVTVSVAAEEQSFVLRADARRLRQVVWNLLSNALKFTDRGGRIDLALERVDSSVRLVVHDTGRGIDPSFLPYVWERFRQGDTGTTREFGGLGLGLAVVRHLVELHGGSVHAESEGLGKGSTFTIELPIGAASLEDRIRDRAGEDTTSRPALSGRHVLVVDDEQDSRTVIAAILKRAGADVATASSPDEAMSVLNTTFQDVVVTDIAMPHEDGISLLRRIRQSAGAHIPVIALTAVGRAEDREVLLAQGFEEFLRKPVEPRDLTRAVRSVLLR